MLSWCKVFFPFKKLYKVSTPLSCNLLCDISNTPSVVLICKALAMLIIPLSDTSLCDTLSSSNVLLFIRYLLMATVPSSDMLLYDMSSFCTLTLQNKNADINIVSIFPRCLCDISHNLFLPSITSKFSKPSHDNVSSCSELLYLSQPLKTIIPPQDMLLYDMSSFSSWLFGLLSS